MRMRKSPATNAADDLPDTQQSVDITQIANRLLIGWPDA